MQTQNKRKLIIKTTGMNDTPIYNSMPNRKFVERAMKRPLWDTSKVVAESYKGKRKV